MGGQQQPISQRDRLFWDGNQFTLFQSDNVKLIFGKRLVSYSPWPDNQTTIRYFLTEVRDTSGNAVARVNYQQPIVPGVSCVAGQQTLTDGGPTGSDPGVPFIATVVSAYGQTLQFAYGVSPGGECVITSVSVVDPAQQDAGVTVQYAYQDGGTGSSLLASAAAPEKVIAYANPPNEFVASVGSSVVTHHHYTGTRVDWSQALYENWTFPTASADVGCLSQSQVFTCVNPRQNSITHGSAGAGDGQTVESFGDERHSNETTWLHEQNFYYAKPDAGVTSASWMFPYQESVEWSTYGTLVPHPFFSVDRRGAYAVSFYTDGGGVPQDNLDGGITYFPQLPELTTLQEGASGADLNQQYNSGVPAGINPLKTTNFTYAYGPHAQQLVHSAGQASVLPVAAGDQATDYTNYDASGRVVSKIRQGNSKSWSAPPIPTGPSLSYTGTFYFTNHACLGDAADPLNRTLEVHGPCATTGPGATDCSGSGVVPITQYYYYPGATPSAPRNANQLQKASKYTNNVGLSCVGANHLDTIYTSYDALGNPTSVTDPNGVNTASTWIGRLMLSSTTAGLTWNYTYDSGTLSSVQMPQGNYEVFCQRTGTSGTGCSGGSWTDRLQWKAKSSVVDGSTWSEKVVYGYWPDGQLQTETYLDSAGGMRKVVHHGSNPLKQPTYAKFGDGSPSVNRSITQFNGAGDVTAVGFPYNNPPDFCGVPGGPVDPRCTALTNDRLGRVTAVDQYPTGSTSVDMHTNITYDAQGNVATVQTGCSSSGACSQPVTTYVYDDFHNVISVAGPWASNAAGTGSNPIASSYDAMGNVVSKQTASMAGGSDYLSYTYDSLGRQIAVVHHYSVPSPGTETLLAFSYDTGAFPDPSCPQPANTAGRAFSRTDSFGTTWYQYDSFGRVLDEIRLRTGTTTCSGASATNAPHTFYTYTNNGNLASITYPYGRTATYSYGTGALTDRPASLSVTTYNGLTWSAQAPLTRIVWEPYGGLRGYQINHAANSTVSTVEYMLGDDGTASPSGCPVSAPSSSTSDHTGLLRGLWVSSGAQAPGTATGDIYKRTYTWQADQVKQIDTCLLGAQTPRTETYAYDAALRLTSAGRPSGNLAATGGAFGSRTYGYDARGNRTSQINEDATYNLTLGNSVNPDWLSLQKAAPVCSLLQHAYAYNLDGNVKQKTWANDSSGGPAYQLSLTSGESDSTSHGGLDSVFKAVSVNGALYNYWYDAFNRRRLKVYPSGAMDEFFYDGENQLLVDQGNDSAVMPTYYVDDDYVWLGGRPVVVVRGKLSTSWARQADSSASCNRNGEAQACGFYFPVTDHIGKPVLMLDSSRRVTGSADYDPFGHANRVTLDAETAHPASCPSGTWIATLADFQQPVGGTANPSTTASFRVLFNLVDTYSSSSNFAQIVDGDTSAVLQTNIGGPHAGQIWSSWQTPSAGHVQVLYSNTGVSGQTCSNVQGVVMEGYEYQRYQSTATPYWTPLRFPGQYYDFETDLAQNWNRFYEPATGRYVEPDPELSDSRILKSDSLKAASPVYSYAGDNPVSEDDPTGLYSEVCWRNVLGPLGAAGAQHCFLRVGGPTGETESYWAKLPVDPFFKKVGPDLNPRGVRECHPIVPPNEPPQCTNARTPFDQCLETAMQRCGQCTYRIFANNCCNCVAEAIASCGGRYDGPWPSNFGAGPQSR